MQTADGVCDYIGCATSSYVKKLNDESDELTSYKVIYIARHGEGYRPSRLSTRSLTEGSHVLAHPLTLSWLPRLPDTPSRQPGRDVLRHARLELLLVAPDGRRQQHVERRNAHAKGH
jgi:hypothetical protein